MQRTLQIPQYLMQTFKLSMDNMQAGVTLLVIGAGAGLSFAGLLSLGTFSAFILFLPILMRAVGDLAAYVQDLGRASLSLDRIEAVKHALLPEREAQRRSAWCSHPEHPLRADSTSATRQDAPTCAT